MKKLLFPGLVLCSIALLMSCCKKEEPQPWYETVPRYYMNEDFKDYFAPGGEGSWYVYYDTLRGMYDTLTVTNVERVAGEYDGFEDDNMDYISENYGLSFQSTYRETPSTDPLHWGLSCYTKPAGSWISPDEVCYAVTVGKGNQVGPSIYYNESQGFEVVDWNEITYVPEVELQGIVYKDVLKCEQDGMFSPMWFAKGIGPIRRAHSAAWTKDFQLIEYHLEPNPILEVLEK